MTLFHNITKSMRSRLTQPHCASSNQQYIAEYLRHDPPTAHRIGMKPSIVYAWVKDIEPVVFAPEQLPQSTLSFSDFEEIGGRDLAPQKPHEYPLYSMASPTKRQRLENDNQELETTLKQPYQSTPQLDSDDVFSTPTASNPGRPLLTEGSSASTAAPSTPGSSFIDALRGQVDFALPITQRPLSRTASIPRSRSHKSPSKRSRKIADLLDLSRPVRFVTTDDIQAELPANMHSLYDKLAKVECFEDIFPSVLRDKSVISGRDIRPFMWQPTESSALATETDCDTRLARAMSVHERMLEVINDSRECEQWCRSEAAWNTIVHYPLLRLFTSPNDSVGVEPITSAQIAPAFRPTFINVPDDAESQLSISTADSANDNDSTASPTRKMASIHKMVDFALVLSPDAELEAAIRSRIMTSNPPTINQSTYYPLRARPAPVFIETKTTSGTPGEANVQLGVWIAAWHESIRRMLHSHSRSDQVIAVPLLYVLDGVWTVMFAVDNESEIRILHRNFQIGNSSTIRGMYQLQAAISAISSWMGLEFQMWMKMVLCPSPE